MSPTNQVKLFDFQLETLAAKLVQLNRRGAKINCPPVTYRVVAVDYVPNPQMITAEHVNVNVNDLPKIKQNTVEIIGRGPRVDGYKFVGTLDHYSVPGKVIVNTVPGEHVPSNFWTAEPICHHCNKIRTRVETFIVENEAGETKQIGRNCLKDFFGHDPMAIARHIVNIMNFVKGLNEEPQTRNSRFVNYFNAHQTLVHTIAVIRTFGWVSRSSASEYKDLTSSIVYDTLTPAFSEQQRLAKSRLMDSIQWNETEDEDQAVKAVQWLRQQSGSTEYMHNLKLLENEQLVPDKMLGYWCSLIAAFHRDQDRSRVSQEKKAYLNEHIGEVGQKIEITVTCTKLTYVDGAYGTVTIHHMNDEAGRALVWFGNAGTKIPEGQTCKIKATVKKFDEYNSRKQTVLTRCKVV